MASECEPSTIIPLPSGLQVHRMTSSNANARANNGDAWWRVAAAELFGTMILLLFTCLPVCLHGHESKLHGDVHPHGHAPSLVQRAFASGLLVACIVQCFDHVSGAQLNPTVTLAAALLGKVRVALAACMCAAQCAGALLGTTVAALIAGNLTEAVEGAVTMPAASLSPYQAVVIEGFLGACLALANIASWDARNRRLVDSWPVRIGLTVAALTFAGGDATGASMNPVRSLAPAMIAGNYRHVWVYIIGPLSGSGVCSALYMWVWRVSPRTPARPATPPPSPTLTGKDSLFT